MGRPTLTEGVNSWTYVNSDMLIACDQGTSAWLKQERWEEEVLRESLEPDSSEKVVPRESLG